jgi:hypothetical protein
MKTNVQKANTSLLVKFSQLNNRCYHRTFPHSVQLVSMQKLGFQYGRLRDFYQDKTRISDYHDSSPRIKKID